MEKLSIRLIQMPLFSYTHQSAMNLYVDLLVFQFESPENVYWIGYMSGEWNQNVFLPVAEPEFVNTIGLICKLDALISFVVVVVVVLVEGKILWVGEGDGDGDCDGERLNKFLIGSAVGNVSLICGDFLAGGVDGVSSISNCFCWFCNLNETKKNIEWREWKWIEYERKSIRFVQETKYDLHTKIFY